MIIFITFIFCANIVSAGQMPSIKQGETALVRQTCGSCSYVNISIYYPNSTKAITNDAMTNVGGGYWEYSFLSTNELGKYDYPTCGDIDGVHTCSSSDELPYFEVKNSNYFLFYTLLGLAMLFFIATLFVNEEFFVYISGILFLISGIYLMINGIDLVNDWYSRGISYVLIGIGLLFSIGAYIFNSYNKWKDEEFD